VTAPVTIYTTSWCGYCIRLKHSLKRAAIDYTEINIETDPEGATAVERINGGNQTVPTVVLPDGTAMTNPSVRDIRAALGS
jgi:mycoredoxin